MQFRSVFFVLFVSSFVLSTQAQNTSPFWSSAGNSNATTSFKLGTTNAVPLQLYTNNTAKAYITTDGKLGIGTTTPQQRLHVEGASNQAIFVNISALSSTSGSGVIGYVKALPSAAGQRLGYFLAGSRGGAEHNYNAAGMVGYAGGAWTGGSSHPAYLAFETTTFGSAIRKERLRIDADGNVGIGTTAPAYNLDVLGATGAHVSNTDNNVDATGLRADGAGYGIRANAYGVRDNDNGFLLGGTAVYAQSSGSYGSGITASATDDYSSGIQGIGSDVEGTGVYGRANIGVSGQSLTGDGIGVRGEGNTGVYGTTNNGGWAGHFDGDVYSSGIYQGSDRKLKQNIAELTNAMSIINKLQPKTYEYRQDGNFKRMRLPQGKRYGLIAQDLEQVLPTLVKDTKFNAKNELATGIKKDTKNWSVRQPAIETAEIIDFKSLNYTELIPILIKGMQEQEAEIEDLKKKADRIDALEKELTDLKALFAGSSISVGISSAYLEQNTPNPSQGTTTVRYRVPDGATSARLMLTNAKGQLLKEVRITKGEGQVNLNTTILPAGVYTYSLLIGEKKVASKQLVITR